MKKPIFTGAAVAIITPMKADGSVDFEEFGRFIDWQIENETDAIVVCGTTGESSTLEVDEHSECIKWCVDYVAGRCAVIAGTGSNSTRTAIELSQEACRDGADALLLVTPYYNKTSQKGLIAHYKAIHDATDKPIILYNVPSRTGMNILPETAYELSKLPRINGVKEASGNLEQIAKIHELCGDELNIWSGNDDQIYDIMERGGLGVISVLSNVCPQETHDIVAKYLDGDKEGSKALMDKYMKLAKALFCDVNPIPVKEAVNLIGYDAGHCRLPLIDMSEENKAMLRNIMNEYGLIK